MHNMAHKNRVWMRQRDVDDLGQDAGWCNVYSYEPAPPSREATLVIQESDKPQRVFTESEVRAILRDLLAASEDGPFIPNYDRMDEMVKFHGLSFDPA